jgi:hypothetical protein
VADDIDDANDVFPVRIGKCVYCESSDSLSDEHVVPYGLGGKWKLLDASCGACRDATSKVERIILREHFLAVRTAAQLPTRRETERPTRLLQKLEGAYGKLSLDLEVDAHPAPLVFPLFATSHTRDFESDAPLKYRALRVSRRKGRLEEIASTTPADKWTLPCADPETFGRFLAKVAYCFAVGSFGLENFREHLVRSFVRTGKPSIGGRITSSDSPASKDDGAHHLSVEVEGASIVTRIRLFAVRGSPTYSVTVGQV